MTPKHVALITTTINMPEMLTHYVTDWHNTDELSDADLAIVVAGDVQTPPEAEDFVINLDGTYISVESMLAQRWRTDKHVGHRSIQRRNIALLHAISTGADLIITVDDDNVPTVGYFRQLLDVMEDREQRVFSAQSGWFNPCSMLWPKTIARGFPLAERHPHEMNGIYAWMTDRKIGVVNGLTTGDPDIDAIERLVNWPKADHLATQTNIVCAPDTWAPFNTQNTAFVRELAPLMQVLVGVGRYDDIFMSYIARVIMDATGWSVSYGEPTTHSVRNDHDIVVDLEKEMYGYKKQATLIAALRKFREEWMQEASGNITHMLSTLYEHISPLLREETIAANKAWIADVETAMKEGAHDDD